MKPIKTIALVSLVSLLTLGAISGFAAKSFVADATKHAIPSTFITHTKAEFEKFKNGTLLIAPFVNNDQITLESLEQFTYAELCALEESLFPQGTEWLDLVKGKTLHGKLSAAKLDKDTQKSVAIVREAQILAQNSFGTAIKNGQGLDLNADNLSDKVSFSSNKDEVTSTIKINKATKQLDGEVKKVVPLQMPDKKLLLFVELVSENDFTQLVALSYNGKSISVLKGLEGGDLQGFDSSRYIGDGIFYSQDRTVPVNMTYIYEYKNGAFKKTGKREQLSFPVISFGANSQTNDYTYSFKGNDLDGKPVTFALGEQLGVLAFDAPVITYDKETFKVKEGYVALINSKNQIGMFKTAESGYAIEGFYAQNPKEYGQLFLIEFTTGFTFIP